MRDTRTSVSCYDYFFLSLLVCQVLSNVEHFSRKDSRQKKVIIRDEIDKSLRVKAVR